MKGLIFSIKRYAIHDGPGIRVTVFMKGCPLSCVWCHNPEGISPVSSKVCQVDRIGDREFRRDEVVGKYYDPLDILAILEKEKVFINQSGGGVTFSGGEPMMQFDFLLEALMLCREKGYHTSLDTSGLSSPDRFRKIIPFTDIFLFDIKHLDNQKHKEYTGASNDEILKNYDLIARNCRAYMVRIPVIPGFNDDEDYLAGLKQYIKARKSKNLMMINLLPYHKIGSSKYKKFNIPWKMENVEQPSARRMNELKDYFSDIGVRVKIGG
jgi:pyruvate formate lyase activating enzyme